MPASFKKKKDPLTTTENTLSNEAKSSDSIAKSAEKADQFVSDDKSEGKNTLTPVVLPSTQSESLAPSAPSSTTSLSDNSNKFIPGLPLAQHSEKLINEAICSLSLDSIDSDIKNISLHIDNLPPTVYDSEILKILSHYNIKVSSCYIPQKKSSSKVYGFVRVASVREAAQLALLFSNALFKGYKLSVSIAKETFTHSVNPEKRSFSSSISAQSDLVSSISQNIKKIKQALGEADDTS